MSNKKSFSKLLWGCLLNPDIKTNVGSIEINYLILWNLVNGLKDGGRSRLLSKNVI